MLANLCVANVPALIQQLFSIPTREVTMLPDRRTLSTLFAFALFLAIPSALEAQAGSRTSLRREIEALNASMVAAFKKEPASVARFYSDDASIIGSGSRSVGRAEIDKYWSAIGGFPDWKLEVLEVGGDSATPWLHGRSTLVSQSGRLMVTEFVGILKRQSNGELKYYIDMYVSAAPSVRPSPPPR